MKKNAITVERTERLLAKCREILKRLEAADDELAKTDPGFYELFC